MSIFAAALLSASTPAVAQSPAPSTYLLNDAMMVDIRLDQRECAGFGCGGYWYREVGADYTLCHDNISRKVCHAGAIDFSLSRFDDELMWQVVELALHGVLHLEVITDSIQVVGDQVGVLTRLRVVDVALSQGAVN